MKYDKTNKCFVATKITIGCFSSKIIKTEYTINDLFSLKDWIYGRSRIFNLKELAKFKEELDLICNKLKIGKIERENFRNYIKQGVKNIEIANKKYKELQ